MSDRDWTAVPNVYQTIAAILGDLLDDMVLRDIAQAAREMSRTALAAVSFSSPGFSSATTIFVRDSLVMPEDFTHCAVTAASDDVFAVPHLSIARCNMDESLSLRSYAGCAVLDRQSSCVAVFYLMDTKPNRLTPAETSRLRAYCHLVSSRIEIFRRFGPGPGPSPGEIVRRAERVASAGQSNEARMLIALAYAADDIAGVRQRALTRVPSRPRLLPDA
jgi:hypothetical protein